MWGALGVCGVHWGIVGCARGLWGALGVCGVREGIVGCARGLWGAAQGDCGRTLTPPSVSLERETP